MHHRLGFLLYILLRRGFTLNSHDCFFSFCFFVCYRFEVTFWVDVVAVAYRFLLDFTFSPLFSSLANRNRKITGNLCREGWSLLLCGALCRRGIMDLLLDDHESIKYLIIEKFAFWGYPETFTRYCGLDSRRKEEYFCEIFNGNLKALYTGENRKFV